MHEKTNGDFDEKGTMQEVAFVHSTQPNWGMPCFVWLLNHILEDNLGKPWDLPTVDELLPSQV